MKLTKQVEKEIRQVYKTFWESLLNVDLKTFNALLDDDFRQIGTTEAEVFFNRKAAAKFLKATEDQLVGNLELRNQQLTIEALENYVLITDLFDAYVKIDSNWTFYSRGRSTFLLHKTPDGWKFLQQHTSVPDHMTEEGETIGLEKISKENIELREAVKRRTIELEQKNSELAIEASLEKVRAIALSMKEPADMLDVCHIISDQLKHLQIKDIRNVQTIIINESKFEYINYQYFTPYDKNSVEQIDYRLHPVELALAQKMLSSPDAFYSKIFKGKDLQVWRDHRKATHQLPDPLLDEVDAAYYYFYSIGSGGIGVTAYSRLSDEALSVFKQFRNVFKLAYRRYIDIELAHEQAKEAQIEAALERVRSRMMAMHQSEDLPEVMNVIAEQLNQLEFKFDSVNFSPDNKNKNFDKWIATSEKTFPEKIFIPYTDSAYFNQSRNAVEGGRDFGIINLSTEETRSWWTYFLENANVSHLSAERRTYLLSRTGTAISTAIMKNTSLDVSNYEGIAFSAAENSILKRFANVFEQTYTRFLDLQKAEAQSREAQIEAALERVRSRMMAMHQSEDLPGVMNVIADQLRQLEFKFDSLNFSPDNKEKGINDWIATSEKTYPIKTFIPYKEDIPFFNLATDAVESGRDFWVFNISAEETRSWWKYFLENANVSHLSAARRNYLLNRIGLASSKAIMKNTSLSVSNYEGIPFSAAENSILKRFANVFEQTYTRFLDLQKAEEQARESQIETALERVRSRTMAMQKSDELAETATLVFQQFSSLGLLPEGSRVFFSLIDEDTVTSEVWMTKEDGILRPGSHRISLKTNKHLIDVYESWKGKKSIYNSELTGSELTDYLKYIASVPYLKEDKTLQQLVIAAPDRLVFAEAFFTQGTIGVIGVVPLTGESQNTLMRFAKVFEQTYTRFLDLQKAEAQVREALIDASLERVRSKTMAMHNSQDVGDTVATMFDELIKLGVETFRCGLGIMQEPYQMEVWTAKKTENKKAELNIGSMDMTKHPLLQAMFNGWKNKDITFSYELRGQDLVDYFTVLNNSSDYHVNYDIASLPQLQFNNDFYFNEGALFSFSTEQLSAEASQIFKRFAALFGQTYRRYLDLQKAEAQAKEAQIETALEKVRSSSMAMHKSDELHQVINVVTEQFQQLGFHFDTANFMTNYSDRGFDWWISTPGILVPANMYCPASPDFLFFNKMSESIKSEVDFYADTFSFEEKNEFFDYVFANTLLKHTPEERRQYIYNSKGIASSSAISKNVILSIGNYQLAPYSEEENAILKRIGKVFEQSYTRFLDLQKAEAQAKEAKIETALEKVRSRTMAMQRSDELPETAAILFQEFKKLGEEDLIQITIGIYNEAEGVIEFNVTSWSGSGAQVDRPFNVSIEEPTLLKPIFSAWKAGEKSCVVDLTGGELEDWINYRNKISGVTIRSEDTGGRRVIQAAFFSKGHISISTPTPLPGETVKILERFAGVFDSTYTRFLDLQKAEAQSREAQIETALERVRSKTMAMHSSDDVTSATATMFIELEKLGVENMRGGIAHYLPGHQMEAWSVSNLADGKVVRGAGLLDTNSIPFWKIFYSTWEKKEDFLYYYLAGKEREDYFKKISTVQNYLSQSIEDVPDLSIQTYYFSEGSVWAFSLKPHSEMDKQVMKRFASVFSLTFRRYQDLKKAETQAREATIELALERVRAKAMAMHSSQDVAETIGVFYRELRSLSVTPRRCGLAMIDKETRMAELTTMNTTEEGDSIEVIGNIKMAGHPVLDEVFEHWLLQKEYHAVLKGNEINEYYKVLKPQILLPDYPHDIVHFGYYFMFAEGDVYAWTDTKLEEDELKIYRRFSSVISLTYKRYKDLRQAEAQAREATIEAALEKVRGKAMVMHNSNDLTATASTVFIELRKLGINSLRAGVALMTRENREAKIYSATDDNLSLAGWILCEGYEVLSECYDSWMRHEDYFPVLRGEHLKIYYQKINPNFTVPVSQTENDEQYGYFLPFSEGMFYGWSEKPYTEAEIKILKRFNNIIDLTFRRYIELQKAEANTRETVKQAALDRVRADIASMRTIADLDRITPLIWNELTILGVPFIRCGVFIMDEAQQLIHTFLSTPEGKAIAAFHLPYDTPGNFPDMIRSWKNKQLYIDHWGETEFANLANALVTQGAIEKREQYLNTLPESGVYLHLLPFLQGMLYVGNTTKLGDEEIRLIQSVTDAFSTAYARYEDFNKLEAAKQQVDKTLADLKLTQAQLVQAEKMASLGELTAGIAHEIQNPLNFVNNFSEVSAELIKEMVDEVDKGNSEEVKAIANDVVKNLEKINHHGKRAADIVKGMLQHSRSSSGVKESTDINALCDEYLRLSYHGLRAKDKSFNATMITDFDESIGNINIIPQDIGRVILNLINNAFYAASLPSEGGFLDPDSKHNPTVWVTTRKVGDKIFISVRDNGPGIPKKILDKIFQPFFTTKPTGQGTGLGLSLSYDIVKAHGGELKVETKEGEGSEFIISIPFS